MPKLVSDEEIKRLIEVDHFIHNKSLRMIERENGIGNGVMSNRCKKLGITPRNRFESIVACQEHIDHPKGDDHWRRNNLEASRRLSKLHSDNMKINNPSRNPETKQKITNSLAITLGDNLTFHEEMFSCFLKDQNIPFNSQQVIDKYIVDFLIGNVIIELDGRGHASRFAGDRIRDKALNDLGFHVVRVNQDLLFNKRAKIPAFRPNKLIAVVEQLIPLMNIHSRLIPDGGKYRVIHRKAYTGAEIIY